MSGKRTINGSNTLYKTPRADSGAAIIEKDFTIYGAGTLGDPYGVNYNVNKTVYVDVIKGNDGTALPYEPLKAYQTINAALGVAIAGDTIHVRAGTYAETINVIDEIDLYFELGCILNTPAVGSNIFSANSSTTAFRLNILGYASIIYDGTSSPFKFKGNNLDISINILDMSYTRRAITFQPMTHTTSKLVLNIMNDCLYDTLSVNYDPQRFMNIAGTSGQVHENIWKVTCGGRMEVQTCITFSSTQLVRIEFHANIFLIADIGQLCNVNSTGATFCLYGNVYSLLAYTPDPYGIGTTTGVVPQMQGNIEIRGNVYSVGQPCFRPIIAQMPMEMEMFIFIIVIFKMVLAILLQILYKQ